MGWSEKFRTLHGRQPTDGERTARKLQKRAEAPYTGTLELQLLSAPFGQFWGIRDCVTCYGFGGGCVTCYGFGQCLCYVLRLSVGAV